MTRRRLHMLHGNHPCHSVWPTFGRITAADKML
jgi:hypothetical protein